MKHRCIIWISVLALVLLLGFLLPGEAQAATVAKGSCGTGVSWTLSDSGTLSISGSGAMDDYDSTLKTVPWYNYLASVKTITFSSSVTHIGDYAFAACVYAKNITIGSGVKTIGEGAFMACVSVTSLSIPKAVTTIGPGAFAQCEALTSCIYQIDAKLTTVGMMAFYDCYALKRVKLPYSTRYIGESAYENCIALNELYIQKGVEFIGDRAFFQCTALTSADIPATVTQIGTGVFAHCTALTKLTATAGGSFVAENNVLFDQDKSLLIQAAPGMTGSYTVPSTVTTIGEASFVGAAGLTQLTIADSVTTIENEAFNGCTGLTTVKLSQNLTKLSKGAFHNCSALLSVVLPDSLEQIDEGAFEGCKAMTSVTFGKNIQAIGNDAFSGCSALTAVTLPETVTYLGHRAFKSCSKLGNMVIPASVQFIGSDIFKGCSKVKTVTFLGDAPHLDEQAFSSSSGTKLIFLESNTTYTEDILSMFGGNKTWVAVPDFSYINGGSCGDQVRWILNEDGTLLILGTGDMSKGSHFANIKSQIKRLVIEDGVTSIAAGVFQGTNIKEVVLPDSMTVVAENAFKDCAYLETVVAQASIYEVGQDAFANTPWLKNQPAGPVYIGNVLYDYVNGGPDQCIVRAGTFGISPYAFENSDVKQVQLPEDLQYIGAYAFQNCSQLEAVNVPDSITSLKEKTFSGCSALKTVDFGTGLEYINYAVFSNCTALEVIELPNSLTTIGNNAFSGCTSLKSIILPQQLEALGSSAFESCSKLQSITIPDKITTIKNWTFTSCSSLSSVNIGKNVTTIERYAFNESGLTSLQLPDNVETIGEYAFLDCTKLQKLTFGKNIKKIGTDAFKGCVKLTSAHIPGTVNQVPYRIFENCTAMTSLTFGDGVTSIGWEIIQNCPNLKKITIPATVTDMRYTFKGSSLEEIVFEGPAPQTISYVFDGLTATAYYPAGDASWTEAIQESFKGTITWVAYEKPEIQKFDIDAARMVLGNALEFQFGVDMSKIPDTTGYYAVIEKAWADGSTSEKTIPAEEWGTVGTYWAIVYDGMAAKEMGDEISVTIYNAKGQAISNAKTDSVRDYVMRNVDKQSDVLKTLMVNMLNYGAAAQLQFNYATDDLANNQLTDTQKAWASTSAKELNSYLVRGTNYMGTRLVLESRIQLQVAFKGMTRDMYAVYTYTDNNGKAQSVRVEGADFVDVGVLGVEMSALVYADARNVVEIIVYNADGTVYGTATDSIEGYVQRNAKGETDVSMELMKFADSAKAYLYGN